VQKIFGPYFLKPNLTLAEKSCLSAWILDGELKKNIFLLPGLTANKTRPAFFNIYTKLNIDGCYSIIVCADSDPGVGDQMQNQDLSTVPVVPVFLKVGHWSYIYSSRHNF
jgi:hypothetical protein